MTQNTERELIKDLLKEMDVLKAERDKALDALTVTQEEWLLRTKRLEAENHRLSNRVNYLEESFERFMGQQGFKKVK